MRSIFLVILSSLLLGCATHNVQLYGKVDQTNKTVTVPAGSKGLKGKLKKALSQRDWKLAVYRGPSVTEGELGKKTRIEQYDTFKTKYRLVASSRQYDLCLNFTPAIVYDISFIDNHSGSEVLTMDGKGCEPEVVKKFIDALSGIDK